jgi:hypothetical protein
VLLLACVLLSVQSFEIPEIGVHRRSWAIDGPGLWVRLVAQTGLGVDEDLVRLLGFGRSVSARTLIGVALAGRAALRMGGGRGHELLAGEGIVVPGRTAFSNRMEARPETSFSLTVEIDSELWGTAATTPSVFRLSDLPRVTRMANALCLAVERAWTEPAARPLVETALRDLFSRLAQEGLPLPAIDPRGFVPLSPSLARIARAVDIALSQHGSRAMIVDVNDESALSARTLQRALPALCAAWGQSVESFREHTRRSLLARACWAMTNPKATTELVARSVGFSTPNAFCRAMSTYGLPSPGRVRQRFLELA